MFFSQASTFGLPVYPAALITVPMNGYPASSYHFSKSANVVLLLFGQQKNGSFNSSSCRLNSLPIYPVDPNNIIIISYLNNFYTHY